MGRPAMHASSDDDVIASIVADVLRGGRPVQLPLWGGSMKPLVRPGARLSLVPARAEELRPGELAVVCSGGQLVVHRFVGRDAAGRVLLLGDAARGHGQCRPHPYPPGDVVGRVDGLPLGRRSWPVPRTVAVAVQRLLVEGLDVPGAAARLRSGWRLARPPRTPFPRLRRGLLRPRLERLGPENFGALRRWAMRRGLGVRPSVVVRLREDLAREDLALWAVRTRSEDIAWLVEHHELRAGGRSHLRPPVLPWRLWGLDVPATLLRAAVTAAAAADAAEVLVDLPDAPGEDWLGALRSLRFDPVPGSDRRRWHRRTS